jgi:hypothetical protein
LHINSNTSKFPCLYFWSQISSITIYLVI